MNGLAEVDAVGHRRRRVARRLRRPVAGHRVRSRARHARGARSRSTASGPCAAVGSSSRGPGTSASHLARLLAAEGAEVVVSDLFESRAGRARTRVGDRARRDRRHARRPRATFSLRARSATSSTTSRSRVCSAVPSSAPPTTSSVSSVPTGCSRHAASCTRPTSSPTPAGSSTSPRSSWATTASARSRTPPRSRRRRARVLSTAADLGITPLRAAEQLARARLADEGAGRPWEPGDPAAWTNGEPLVKLRPYPPRNRRQLWGIRRLLTPVGAAADYRMLPVWPSE